MLTALEKLPADRWGSAAEFAAALGGQGGGRAGGRTPPTSPSARPPARPIALLAALAVTAALAAWGWLRPRPAAPVARYEIEVPGLRQAGLTYSGHSLAISPDGSRLAYVASDGIRPSELWIRDRGSTVPRSVPGSAGADAPFFTGRRQVARLSSPMASSTRSTPRAGRPRPWRSPPVALSPAAPGCLTARCCTPTSPSEFGSRANEPGQGRDACDRATTDWVRGRLSHCPQAQRCRPGHHLHQQLRPHGARGRRPAHRQVEASWWTMWRAAGTCQGQGILVMARPDGSVLAASFDAKTLELRGTPVPVLTGVQVGQRDRARDERLRLRLPGLPPQRRRAGSILRGPCHPRWSDDHRGLDLAGQHQLPRTLSRRLPAGGEHGGRGAHRRLDQAARQWAADPDHLRWHTQLPASLAARRADGVIHLRQDRALVPVHPPGRRQQQA